MKALHLAVGLTSLIGMVTAHGPLDCSGKYTVQAGETCSGLGSKFGNFSYAQLYRWNPEVTRQCVLAANQKLCVGTYSDPVAPPLPQPGMIVSEEDEPVPVYPCAPLQKCDRWFLAGGNLGVEVSQRLFGIPDGVWKSNFCEKDGPPKEKEFWKGYWYCMKLKA